MTTAATSTATNTAPSTQPVSLEGSAANNQNISGIMEFTLSTTQPGAQAAVTSGTTNATTQGQAAAAAPSTSSVNATSTDLLSDTGGIHANVMWSPTPIQANTESSAKFNFTDAFSGELLMRMYCTTFQYLTVMVIKSLKRRV